VLQSSWTKLAARSSVSYRSLVPWRRARSSAFAGRRRPTNSREPANRSAAADETRRAHARAAPAHTTTDRPRRVCLDGVRTAFPRRVCGCCALYFGEILCVRASLICSIAVATYAHYNDNYLLSSVTLY